MRETDTTTTDVVPDDYEDDAPLCSWCAELRHDLDAALPFCDRCLSERVPLDLLVRIATTSLSLLSRRVLGVPPRP